MSDKITPEAAANMTDAEVLALNDVELREYALAGGCMAAVFRERGTVTKSFRLPIKLLDEIGKQPNLTAVVIEALETWVASRSQVTVQQEAEHALHVLSRILLNPRPEQKQAA